MPLLTASDLNVSYGDVEVFSDVSLEVAGGARIGLVGPNGGGKTSLLSVLVGQVEPSVGNVYRPSGLRISYVPQVTPASAGGTIRDEIMLAFREVVRLEDDIASAAVVLEGADGASRRPAERRYSSLLARYEALGGHDYVNRAERVADGVGLTPQTLAKDAETASGGERTRAALAAALLTEPDLLILDEPTNYLDFRGLAWLEKLLDGWHRAFVVVSHDRFFLDATVRQVWELEPRAIAVLPCGLHEVPGSPGRACGPAGEGVRAPAGSHRQGAGVHRQVPRRPEGQGGQGARKEALTPGANRSARPRRTRHASGSRTGLSGATGRRRR